MQGPIQGSDFRTSIRRATVRNQAPIDLVRMIFNHLEAASDISVKWEVEWDSTYPIVQLIMDDIIDHRPYHRRFNQRRNEAEESLDVASEIAHGT